jgi:hypothetical protein
MTDVLSQPANQTSFAALVGVSKQAIQKHAGRIGLKRGGTHAEWLKVYCDHLRAEAGRQGGESQADLTRQRILESEQKTLAMSLDNMEKLRALIAVDSVGEIFGELTSAVHVNFNSAAENILGGLESKYSIKIDDELVYGPLRAATERIAGTARKLSERVRQDS